MKKQPLLSLILVILLTFSAFPAAMADRTANAWDCSSAGIFLNKLEIGTVVDFDCAFTEGAITCNLVCVLPAIKGCNGEVVAYFPKSCLPDSITVGQLFHVHGTVSDRISKTDIAFYMSDDTKISEATIQPRTYDLNTADLILDNITIYDTVTGTGEVVNTSDTADRHIVVFRSGLTLLSFDTDTKEFFKGDQIQFVGNIGMFDFSTNAHDINLSSVSLVTD